MSLALETKYITKDEAIQKFRELCRKAGGKPRREWDRELCVVPSIEHVYDIWNEVVELIEKTLPDDKLDEVIKKYGVDVAFDKWYVPRLVFESQREAGFTEVIEVEPNKKTVDYKAIQESYMGADGFKEYVLDLAEDYLNRLREELKKRGYSDEAIEKILDKFDEDLASIEFETDEKLLAEIYQKYSNLMKEAEKELRTKAPSVSCWYEEDGYFDHVWENYVGKLATGFTVAGEDIKKLPELIDKFKEKYLPDERDADHVASAYAGDVEGALEKLFREYLAKYPPKL